MKLQDILRAWSHEDDWGVAVVSLSLLGDILEALEAGDDAISLYRHAAHLGPDCVTWACAEHIPHFTSPAR